MNKDPFMHVTFGGREVINDLVSLLNDWHGKSNLLLLG